MLETEFRRASDDAFVVRTDDPELQAVLPGLAYPQESEEEFVRRFPRDSATPEIYERFAKAAPGLLGQTARRERAPWEEVVERVHQRLEEARVDWLLGGSTALAVRGVQVQPRDIDFTVMVHETTAATFADLLIEPPLNGEGRWIAEWFGRAWDGMRIEWVAQPRRDLDDHDWTSDIGPEADRRAEVVEWRGLRFRVPPLDLQLAVTRERGLEDRVAAIEAFLRP